MKERNFTFTKHQVDLLVQSVLTKMEQNGRARTMISNSAADIALGIEQRELKDLLDYLTNKED